MIPWLLYPALVVVAFLYASVGHGGASGYLALLALFGADPATMKPTALLLNLFVSLVAFVQFRRGGFFRARIFWPLAVASMPLAYVGGTIALDATLYKRVLGAFLLVPVLRFLLPSPAEAAAPRPPVLPIRLAVSLPIGAAIGLLSGLIGIGGGILLSPILVLLRWTTLKESAAISALFIFVNSATGLAGQYSRGVAFGAATAGYVVAAFAGGMLGASFGAWKFGRGALEKILAAVLAIAAYKLLFTAA